MEINLLTISGMLVMSGLAYASLRLHFKSRAYARRYDEDHQRWRALRDQEELSTSFPNLRAQVEESLTGPLGQVLSAKVELFPNLGETDSSQISEQFHQY